MMYSLSEIWVIETYFCLLQNVVTQPFLGTLQLHKQAYCSREKPQEASISPQDII